LAGNVGGCPAFAGCSCHGLTSEFWAMPPEPLALPSVIRTLLYTGLL
jgi:hypothetical protein